VRVVVTAGSLPLAIADPFSQLTIGTVSATLPCVQAYRHDAWTALGDPTRRAIFERVAARSRAVGELARELPVSRPAVSQHLKGLNGWSSTGRPATAVSMSSTLPGSALCAQIWIGSGTRR
jgi:hypothetical protein